MKKLTEQELTELKEKVKVIVDRFADNNWEGDMSGDEFVLIDNLHYALHGVRLSRSCSVCIISFMKRLKAFNCYLPSEPVSESETKVEVEVESKPKRKKK